MSKYRRFLTKLLVAVTGCCFLVIIGIFTTRLFVPDYIAQASASEKPALQQALMNAQFCLDNPIQRIPIVRYSISVTGYSPGNVYSNSAATEPGQVPTFQTTRPSIIAGASREPQVTGEVIAYSLFAIPLHKISVGNPSASVCKVL